jgi:hypothetical protein
MRSALRVLPGVLVSLLALTGAGCSGGAPADPADSGQRRATADDRAAPPRSLSDVPPGVKRSALGKHVWLETEGQRRRVRVEASVCLRQGGYGLEFLLSKKFKAYESVLSTEADAQLIHAALVTAGAVPGSPVRFDPQFKPPSGSQVKVTLEYEDHGKVVRVPAGHWVRDVKTKQELDSEWVFAGSRLWPNPDGDDKPKLYAANGEGAYVCVINLPTAMLDLPIRNDRGATENRAFEPFTEHIPEIDTPVVVVFEPVGGSPVAGAAGKE